MITTANRNIGGFISKCRTLVFVAPHRCVQPDPTCDIRSGMMTRWFRDRVASALPNSVKIFVLLSQVTRSVCDPNRATCSHASVRRQLRQVMDMSPKACIIEIHSFPRHIATTIWKLRSVPNSVVLNIRGSAFETEVSQSLGSTTLVGNPTVNDIGKEATLKGWNHVLLELCDDLVREDVEALANKLVKWEKKIK